MIWLQIVTKVFPHKADFKSFLIQKRFVRNGHFNIFGYNLQSWHKKAKIGVFRNLIFSPVINFIFYDLSLLKVGVSFSPSKLVGRLFTIRVWYNIWLENRRVQFDLLSWIFWSIKHYGLLLKSLWLLCHVEIWTLCARKPQYQPAAALWPNLYEKPI